MTTKKHAVYGILVMVSLLGLGITQSAKANQLIANGDFETGTFADWTVVDQAGGSGSFFISNPGAGTPFSGHSTAANPSGGNFYAVSDQGGPGCHVLLQSFTIAPGASNVQLSFQMFVNNYAGVSAVSGLDYTAVPNEHGRVDILSGSATAFDTGAGVVDSLFIGSDVGPNPNPYTSYSFNLSSLAAGTYQLRFAEADNQGFFNQGVDNVSITESVPDSGSTVALLGVAMIVVGMLHRRIKAATNRA